MVNPPVDPPIHPHIVLPEPPIVDVSIDPIEPQVVPPLQSVEHVVVQPPQPLIPPRARQGEAKLAYEVVLNLVSGLKGKGHLLVMDNYFSSIGLFQDLLRRCIYSTSTMGTNRIGLPMVLKNTKAFKRSSQGTTEWQMHQSRSISCVMWKDKKPVLLSLHMLGLFNLHVIEWSLPFHVAMVW